MRIDKFLLGAAAGFAAGYAVCRACEAAAALARRPQKRPRDPAAYGAARRALAVAAIARSLAGAAAFAYGPLGERLQRRVAPLPEWLQPSAFAALGMLLETAAELPVDFIEGHQLEQRYDLSDQSAASWLSDSLKQGAIGMAVTTILSGLFGAALRKWPRAWPYAASAGVFPLLVLANIVMPIYIMPLFNEYRPIEGPLERRLRALAQRFGVGDAQILRVDMSKQTKKANAFVTGVFDTHRIVVGDTLIEHFPEEEIEFVVAHELGHYVSKDSWRLIAAGQIAATIVFFGAAAALRSDPAPAPPLRSDPAPAPLQLARVQCWATLISQLLRPAIGAFSRSREWAADRFAVQTTEAPETGASAFRRLRDQNLAEDEQPAWFEFVFSTHPSLKDRIEALSSS